MSHAHTSPIPIQVESEWKKGNHEGAYYAAHWAKAFGIGSIISGVILLIAFAILATIVSVVFSLPNKS